jgi:hypothetical protein
MPESGAANHVARRTHASNGGLARALPGAETSQRFLWVCSLTDARVATFPVFFQQTEPGRLTERRSGLVAHFARDQCPRRDIPQQSL